jgi:arylsulfatase A-like enzyme
MKNNPKPLRVILVCLDQLRPFELGCYGHPEVKTPHIDRLAAGGVRFEVAVSNNPVCTPARSILTSGQYSRTCAGMMGNWGPPDRQRDRFPAPTFPEVLANHGFTSGHVGKWHVHVHPHLLGFTNYPSVEDTGGATYFPAGKSSGGHSANPYGPEGEEALLREYLANRPGGATYLFHNIHLPHGPWRDAGAWLDRHDQRPVQLRPNIPADIPRETLDHWAKTYHFGGGKEAKATYPLAPDYGIEDFHRHYCAAIERADQGVGVLIEELEKRGELESTLLIFTSDHGENLGSHGWFNKETMNEESIRIPLIFHWPEKLTPGVRNKAIASLVDLPPTILGLLGLATPGHFQGRDLSAVVRGEVDTLEPNEAFIEGMQDDIAIRTPDFLYGMKMRGGWNNVPKREVADDAFQCYDLRTDPYQRDNLARRNALPPEAAALRERLLEWNKTTPWLNEVQSR